MPEQPYGVEVWDTEVEGSGGDRRYYWRLYYTVNGEQAATSDPYTTQQWRDQYANQIAEWGNLTVRDRYTSTSKE